MRQEQRLSILLNSSRFVARMADWLMRDNQRIPNALIGGVVSFLHTGDLLSQC